MFLERDWNSPKKVMARALQITRSDGRPDTVLHTEWTQKGRLLIHEILTVRGFQAIMDREKAS